MVRVHAILESCGEDGAGGSGHILVNYDRESSVVMTGLSLGPRGSGAVNTVAASGNPSLSGPPLGTSKTRTSLDERGWSRRLMGDAGSGCDGPELEAEISCCSAEPLVAVGFGK